MKEIKVTNLIKLYALLLLTKKQMHGYELIKELQKCIGQKISTSHVYPFLKELEKNKLVFHINIGKREKKYYKLTNKGKKFVKSLMERFGSLTEILIKTKLEKCAHCDCEIYKGAYKSKIKGKICTFCCKSCALFYNNTTKSHPH